MCQYGLLSIVLKYRSIWSFLITVFMGQFLIANENAKPLALPENLKAWCHEKMASYKIPDQFHWSEQLPRNPSGKVKTFLLRKNKNKL